MFKFQIGDSVKKKSGYLFNGIVVGRYEVEAGNRYDVQINGVESINRLHEMMKEKKVVMTNATVLMELEDLLMNCHGMIHIFSEEQLVVQ